MEKYEVVPLPGVERILLAALTEIARETGTPYAERAEGALAEWRGWMHARDQRGERAFA